MCSLTVSQPRNERRPMVGRPGPSFDVRSSCQRCGSREFGMEDTLHLTRMTWQRGIRSSLGALTAGRSGNQHQPELRVPHDQSSLKGQLLAANLVIADECVASTAATRIAHWVGGWQLSCALLWARLVGAKVVTPSCRCSHYRSGDGPSWGERGAATRAWPRSVGDESLAFRRCPSTSQWMQSIEVLKEWI